MLGLLGKMLLALGRATAVASSTGNAHARLVELLTNRLTTTRASNIDNLDAAISGRLGSIKTMQRGKISLAASTGSGTATITSVTTSKARIFKLGSSNSSGLSGVQPIVASVELTNATTVTARHPANQVATDIGYEVAEYN